VVVCLEHFFENHPKWDPATVEMHKLTDGPVGKGSRGIEVRRFGREQEAEFVVSQFEPMTLFAFDNVSGPFSLERAYAFRSVGEQTGLDFRFRMAPKGAMKAFFPVLRRTIARQVEANIDRLTDLLNSRR
jgi:hypothetical protein